MKIVLEYNANINILCYGYRFISFQLLFRAKSQKIGWLFSVADSSTDFSSVSMLERNKVSQNAGEAGSYSAAH